MDKNKEKVKLNDELLDKISGGGDDYNVCDWSPTELHEWEPAEPEPGGRVMICRWCGIRYY